MTRVNPTAAWSSQISTAQDTPVQCLAGYCKINWASVEPSSTEDGLELGPGDIFVIPAGQSFRHVASRSTSPTLFYEEFT